ncbi:ORF6N domain-containing protein [Komagataeibacter kakiaceti]|uniref:ORF6N domain-containing protein n=1 Tax=Komagataeibacter kakiaceti TaxID=943261 RepID=UPI000686353A|nr:ORF6N domain-containing protein [Komagataeibacter kakiaceti]
MTTELVDILEKHAALRRVCETSTPLAGNEPALLMLPLPSAMKEVRHEQRHDQWQAGIHSGISRAARYHLRMVDALHQRAEDTAGRNFRANRKRFIEGTDFFSVCADEIRRYKIMEISAKARGEIILLTESGYLMLVKSFTDDLAWTVQRELVTGYFRVPRQPELPRNTLATMEPTELNARIGACRRLRASGASQPGRGHG